MAQGNDFSWPDENPDTAVEQTCLAYFRRLLDKNQKFTGGLAFADISRLRGWKQKEKEAKENQGKENQADSKEGESSDQLSHISLLIWSRLK